MRLPIISNPELSRFSGSLLGRLALIAIVLVPSLYGGLLIWSNLDATTHLNRVPAAVVNQDRPVTVEGSDGTKQPVALGRSIAASLTTSDAANNFDWELTDASDADAGLKNGKYYAVLTLPQDMSKDATSTSDANTATAAVMDLRTNDAVSYLSGNIANTISTTVTANAGNTLTGAYLNNVYLGFNGIHANLSQANSGAEKLADGASSLSAGATKLATGTGQLKNGVHQAAVGSDRIADGAGRLATGAGSLATGSSRVADGAGRVSAGADQLYQATKALPGQVNQLATGGQQVADGAARLGAGAATLGTNAARFGTGAQSLSTNAGTLASGAQRSATGAQAVADGVGAVESAAQTLSNGVSSYTRGVDGLAAQCSASGAASSFCQQLEGLSGNSAGLRSGADRVAAGTGRLSDGARQSASGMSQVATGAARLSDGAATLAGNAPALATAGNTLNAKGKELSAGGRQLSAGLRRLNSATPQLRSGMAGLSSGSTQVASGARQVASGAAALDSGAGTLAGSTRSLSSGLTMLDTGASSLQKGAGDVAAGAKRLNSGASQLHSGLTKGVDQIPTYSKAQREQLERTVSNPVTSNMTRDNSVPAYGYSLAPYFGALALWVGAMGMFFVIRPLSQRAISSTARPWRVALNGYAMPVTLGLVQTLVLYAVLHWWMGLEIATVPGFLAISALSSATFVAVNHCLNAVLGTPGRFASLLFTVLQLSAAGATYPIETTPGFFQTLHPFLPLTYAVQGLRATIAGGAFNLHPVIWVLAAWLIGALLLTTLAAHSQRRWTVARLRPAMTL